MNVRRSSILLAGVLFLVACQDKKSGPAGAGSAAASSVATLKGPATPVKAGQPFTVAWTGPNGPNDYVDLVVGGHLPVGDELGAARTSAGNPAKLTAPATAGAYDVRYVHDTGNRAIIGRATITVVP